MAPADEDIWWDRFVERVREEAERRGGRAVVSAPSYVRLDPPEGSTGETVHLTRYDDGQCKLEVGFLASFMAGFVDFEDDSGILSYVLAVLDGHATESVDISATGEWVGVRTAVKLHDGGARSYWPAPGQGAEPPAARTFDRRIGGWSSLRFVAG